MTGVRDTISSRIRQARVISQRSQEACAAQLGVASSTWNGWERGRFVCRADVLADIAAMFGRDPGWFYDDDDLRVAA
jgi:transcriptional regulator with XRE-family HTH domain